MTTKTKTVSGVLREPLPKLLESKKGGLYCNFCIMTKEGLQACMAFDSVAEKICAFGTVDKRISLSGYTKNGEDALFIKQAEFAGDVVQTVDLLVREYGSTEAARERLKELIVEREKNGLVLAHRADRSLVWRPKDTCIEINGVWMEKIEHLMNVLGPETVVRVFRDWAKEGMQNAEKTDKRLLRFDGVGYQKMIDELMKQAGEVAPPF